MRPRPEARSDDDAPFPFVLLSALFVAALVTMNLIASKFVTVDLGFHTFVISAGILPYPVTFLVTDLLSEIYGRRAANRVVISGFVASIFVLGSLWLGDAFRSIEGSPVDDDTYYEVFHRAWRVIGSSMIAYLTAQFVDIRMFHFWKRLTNGRHLWLRNNASTVVSQLLDTILVISVLFIGVKSFAELVPMILDGWFFKTLCAFVDTPVIYGAVALFRHYGIEPAVEPAGSVR